MIKFIKIFLLLTPLILQNAYAEPAECKFTLEENSLKVGWTAFKTTDKVAVNGEFSKVNITNINSANSLADLLDGLTVRIDKLSVQTQNPERDKTLADFFFAKLNGEISGEVTNFNLADKVFTLMLSLNNSKNPVVMRFESTNDKEFKATGSIDLLQFNSATQLSSLNNKCIDLHRGPDGVSKTWSEVQINLAGVITSDCSKS